MKALLSALAVCAILVLFAALTVVELLIRLAPLLIVAAIGWALVAAARARRRRHADDARLLQVWAQQHTPAAAHPPLAPSHPAPARAHRERAYLVGHDTGVTAPRVDPYLHVDTPALPPAVAPRRKWVARARRRAQHRTRPGGTRP